MDDNRGNVLGRDGNSHVTGPEWMKGIKGNVEADLVSKSQRECKKAGWGGRGGWFTWGNGSQREKRFPIPHKRTAGGLYAVTRCRPANQTFLMSAPPPPPPPHLRSPQGAAREGSA